MNCKKKNTDNEKFFFIDLKYFKTFDLNRSCYFYFYFENITLENKVTIEIINYQTFPFTHDKFNLVQGNDFIINNYGFNYARFFFIPCLGKCRIDCRNYNEFSQYEGYYPFKESYR